MTASPHSIAACREWRPILIFGCLLKELSCRDVWYFRMLCKSDPRLPTVLKLCARVFPFLAVLFLS